MRRTLLALAIVAGALLLAACGNKGPLVRAPAHGQAAATTGVAPASSSVAPADVSP